MRRVRAPHDRAFGLIELVVTALIAAVALVASIQMMRGGLGASEQSIAQGMVQEEALRTVESVVRELKDSGVTSTGWTVGVNPNVYNQYYDTDVGSIQFSRCTGYDVTQQLLLWGPVVTYSFVPPTGSEPGRVQRKEGATTANVCDHVVSFTVHYVSASNLVIVSLGVQVPDPENASRLIGAGCTKQVKLRN